MMYDDAIVGAGIVGLAHAYTLAQRGRRVLVVERSARAAGASRRNFGMLWPIGQPFGPRRRLADRSLEIWRELVQQTGLWHAPCGSLHLAHHDDEAEVFHEFSAHALRQGLSINVLDTASVARRCPAAKLDRLRAGLWSPHEICVDPREVLDRLPQWLHETLGVKFAFGVAVVGYERPTLRAFDRSWQADRLWLCPGDDLVTLFTNEIAALELQPCKLQMLRATFDGPRIGPLLATGLSLRHYASFADCAAVARVRERVARELPAYDRFGIHILVSQFSGGELVIGDSHEFGDAIEPFDKAEIDALVLDYLVRVVELPNLRICERWHGTYAKHPSLPYSVIHTDESTTLVVGLGGQGMTLAFGLAEQVVHNRLGDGAKI